MHHKKFSPKIFGYKPEPEPKPGKPDFFGNEIFFYLNN